MKDIRPKRSGALFILIAVLSFFLFSGLAADAGVYLNSAHGDGNYGVNRSGASGFPTDYPEGFCAHCHEQHASIGGSEPAPAGSGPSDYLLFYTNHTSQTDNFCYQCHTGSGSYQYNESAIMNLLYSERAGKWNTSPDDILEAFSYSSPGTSHNLDNISTFIASEWSSYTSDSNPCNACHNPHAAQGDPQGDGGGTTAAKSTILANRGWPISRPSLHNTNNNTWGLWGDGSGEKMSDYASSVSGTYQATYQYNTASAYEPAACTSSCNGSDLTDYVTFCSDCHNDSNTISSTTLGRSLYKFNWANEKHGGTDAANDGTFGGVTIDDLISPYDETSVTDYVLSCTDCHEPHGSANRFLIREGVNGGTSVTDVEKLASETPDNTKQWKSLCSKCHDVSTNNNKTVHHRAYQQEYGSSYTYCIYCHEPDADDVRNCLQCHYHGNTQWPAVTDYGLGAHTYNSGEKMF